MLRLCDRMARRLLHHALALGPPTANAMIPSARPAERYSCWGWCAQASNALGFESALKDHTSGTTPSDAVTIPASVKRFGCPLYQFDEAIVQETAKPGARRPILGNYREAAKVVVWLWRSTDVWRIGTLCELDCHVSTSIHSRCVFSPYQKSLFLFSWLYICLDTQIKCLFEVVKEIWFFDLSSSRIQLQCCSIYLVWRDLTFEIGIRWLSAERSERFDLVFNEERIFGSICLQCFSSYCTVIRNVGCD